MRKDGRAADTLRPVKITRNYISSAEGSVLFEVGSTRVICTASIEDSVPSFLKGTGKGWVTAEYSMLPRATSTRTARESVKGRQGGRTQEIQRLIGRSLRSIMDMQALGERTIYIDCDVIQADGGTRTASITGAFICLADAVRYAMECGMVQRSPMRDYVAAISVGIVDETPVLDLCYEEDSRALVDMNVVMTGSGAFVEVQGTAEGHPFTKPEMDSMLALATSGITQLINTQKELLGNRVIK